MLPGFGEANTKKLKVLLVWVITLPKKTQTNKSKKTNRVAEKENSYFAIYQIDLVRRHLKKTVQSRFTKICFEPETNFLKTEWVCSRFDKASSKLMNFLISYAIIYQLFW